MLQRLYISNYAIISELTFEPQSHFNVITGETGAGKSILIGALSLIMGERADTSVLLNDNKCLVEATFELQPTSKLKSLFEQHDLDWDTSAIIRREIAAKGKSRAFINDTPVTLPVLQDITSQLIDLHQQFDNLHIRDENFQTNVLDTMADNALLLQDYQQQYKHWTQLKQKFENLQAQLLQAQNEQDYNTYLYQELEAFNIQPEELELLEASIKQLSNKETIIKQLSEAYQLLEGDEVPALQQIKRSLQLLQQVGVPKPDIWPLTERLQGVYEETKDISAVIQEQLDQLSQDHQNPDDLIARYDLGQRLLKKHAVSGSAALKAIEEALKQTLDLQAEGTEQLQTLQTEIETTYNQLLLLGAQLSERRQQVAPVFAEQVSSGIYKMGMVNAQFQIQLGASTTATASGLDTISFELDANKTGKYLPLQKSASGGELSRIMLAIKSLMAGKMYMPTLIFDEVDTGISGEAAKQVGLLLKQLGAAHQVISITHQPQIAAMAHDHYYVYKAADKQGQITTKIKDLQDDNRLHHIAEMITGKDRTAASIDHAKELLAR